MAAGPSMPDILSIPLGDYYRKVHASWIGQCVGNMFGLGYENLFIEEPMPEGQAPVWAAWVLDLIRAADGAFSDDDTDIEYMYLLAMEAAQECSSDAVGDVAGARTPHPPGPREVTYDELARRWMHHVRSHVWVANRAALGLMHHGLHPPLTGRRGINPHWFQIDPQLVNEIWGVTAPGMLRYAADRTAWAARIMADDWGLEPAVHYGVMYAAAFFEHDVGRLVDRACDVLPAGSRFAGTVRQVRRWHAQHADDWRSARRRVFEHYFLQEDPPMRTIWNANLNGAAGILALLYGGGDFRRTLEMCCRIGFDTDNQAATMCGLVAIITGLEGIPGDLLYPLHDRGWDRPFNDRYHIRTRFDLPDARLSDLSRRIADQGVATVLRLGGRLETDGGEPRLMVPCEAIFQPPPEGPAQTAHAAPSAAGRVSGARGERDDGSDLTAWASEILTHQWRLDEAALARIVVFTPRALLAEDVEIVRQQRPLAAWPPESIDCPRSFYGFADTDAEQFYGYRWPMRVVVNGALLRLGTLEEAGGWFVDPHVEFEGDNGTWIAVDAEAWTPPYPRGEEPLTKAPWVQYVIRFQPVETRALRLVGRAGGTAKFTSIASLAVTGWRPQT